MKIQQAMFIWVLFVMEDTLRLTKIIKKSQKSQNRFCLSLLIILKGVMAGLLVGGQLTDYFATQLGFEFLSSYGGVKKTLFTETLIDSTFKFYTFGPALDFLATIPLTNKISLSPILGCAYKKPYIYRKPTNQQQRKIFKRIGFAFIPRAGFGLLFSTKDVRCLLKLLAELNNVFKYGNESVFDPSVFLGISGSYCFK